MKFSTPVPIHPSQPSIGYDSSVLLLGSCFANNIAEKLQRLRFVADVNPFGILFQPTSLEDFIRLCLENHRFAPAGFFEHASAWHHFKAHSQMDALSASEACQKLNSAADAARLQMASATHIIITLGTAWVYRHRASGEFVANCHKVPQREFDKQLLSIERIGESLKNITSMLRAANPSATIIFTVSPVRHLKDGFVENQRSKAHLIAALHNFLETDAAHYFPAYEIAMDELRDYRFYAGDMVHPSADAVQYIWERFSAAWISNDARKVADEVEGIVRGLEHRPFNPESAETLKFRANLESRIASLQSRFRHMKF